MHGFVDATRLSAAQLEALMDWADDEHISTEAFTRLLVRLTTVAGGELIITDGEVPS